MNCYSGNDGGAVYWTGTNNVISNCSFMNCYSRYDGGAVYWTGTNNVMSNCSFVNSYIYSSSSLIDKSSAFV